VVEPNCVYHVSPRGNDGRVIFETEVDRRRHVSLLTEAVSRFRWWVLGYCQMGTHYHLVVQLPHRGLSEGMRWLQSEYSRYWNKENGHSGHLFRQHFDGRLVTSESYLRTVLRYVDLNPIIRKDVFRPEQWRWSSYRAHVGLEHAPQYLNLSAFHRLYGDTPDEACRVYLRYVTEGLHTVSDTGPWADPSCE
jgi:REP element-mobilizing transposase RayT